MDDYVNKRGQFRNLHLQKLQVAYQQGELVLAGALADPVDGAVLVFRDAGKAEEFAKSDPYVLNGLVHHWRVRPWTTVIGDGVLQIGSAPVIGRPEPSEYAPYAKAYVDLVVGNDVMQVLASQLEETVALLKSLDERRRSEFAYAPGKWTVKQVLGHVIDSERIFAYRALRIARSDTTPLPGFEQEDYVNSANFNATALPVLLDEFRITRLGTIALFRSLPAEAWSRAGVANQFNSTVRGLAFQLAGHEQHHVKILREKYL